ncbi:MAG TPA: PA0069 family radical SAM protein [Aromatoleum sp.]|uniref:PA0069 family radical SAM protein n=1 Tax=Aromatoleum sp. TaxID=2307007 RepID=UPI002B492012|nr:PA0069 family radical SAM protein [Aromatoleum sp.]HJV26579.1 PA0069 family radical SAM protein [Aromatoleum sp.]
MDKDKPGLGMRGRGAASNAPSRFLEWTREAEPNDDIPPEGRVPTALFDDRAKTVISWNQSPDIPFDRSVNPAKGCELGCIYCYARPLHAYLGLSPGLDFETRIFVKRDAAAVLRGELSRPGYRPGVLALGAATDPYQPFERELGITRQILEVLAEFKHPVSVTTKGALVERDIDLLAPLAAQGLAQVNISLPTLDPELARRLEPRATAPHRRVETLRRLAEAGIPTAVLVAPIIPALTDHEIEHILDTAAAAGVSQAAYVLLRLPREVRDLFVEWLEQHYPDRANHVMSLVRQAREGRDYDARFGSRMSGAGNYADLIRQRFQLACRRHGLNERALDLRTDLFHRPAPPSPQLALF